MQREEERGRERERERERERTIPDTQVDTDSNSAVLYKKFRKKEKKGDAPPTRISIRTMNKLKKGLALL